MSDPIERQAAIDALAKNMPRLMSPDGTHPADEEIYKAIENYVDCIETIALLPSAQPEIIRCKDCKNWAVQVKDVNGDGLGSCKFHKANFVT